MKIKVFIIALFLVTSTYYQVHAIDTIELKINDGISKNDFFDSYKTLLAPVASEAIRDHFPDRSYGLYDMEVLEIERIEEGGFFFRVKAQYYTYTGAHNPPKGIDTITFDISPHGTKVIDYKHQEIRETH